MASAQPDLRVVAVPCRGKVTRIWDTARGALLAELPPAGADAPVPVVSVDGSLAAIARDRTVDLYEVPGGRLIRSIDHGASVSAVSFAGRDVVSGDTAGVVLLTPVGAAPSALPSAAGAVDAIVVLGDGRIVVAAVAGASGALRVFDRGRVVADLAAPSRVDQLRAAADGRRLVTIPIPGSAAAPALWDLERYQLVGQLDGHVGRVFAARWNGERLLTAGADGAVRMWDSTGSLVMTYRGGAGAVLDAALSPDGTFLVGGGTGGLLRVWDPATGRQLWRTPAHKDALVGVHFEGEDVVTRGAAGDLARWRLTPN